MMAGARGQPWSAAFYWAAYDKPARVAPRTSLEEDPASFRGAFYLAMVKLFDVTVEGRRIQGYNSLSDWDEMRDYLFRRVPAQELPAQLTSGKVQIHGGNAAWPRQQIASELIRSPRLREAVEAVAFGATGETPGTASEEEVAARLGALLAIARAEGAEPGALSLGSKVLHAFAPARWPAHWTRTSPEVGEELGVALPDVQTPADYLRFAAAVRTFAQSRGDADLVATDVAFNNAYEEIHAGEDAGDDEEADKSD